MPDHQVYLFKLHKKLNLVALAHFQNLKLTPNSNGTDIPFTECLLQCQWHQFFQDTVTLKLACVITARTSRTTVQTGSGGEGPLPPPTLGQKEIIPPDLVK